MQLGTCSIVRLSNQWGWFSIALGCGEVSFYCWVVRRLVDFHFWIENSIQRSPLCSLKLLVG